MQWASGVLVHLQRRGIESEMCYIFLVQDPSVDMRVRFQNKTTF